MLTLFGACVVTFMMVMYALEGRGRRFVLAFAVGCALSSTYGWLAGTWPFGIVEGVWSIVALKRYVDQRSVGAAPPDRSADSSASSASTLGRSATLIDSRCSDVS
jgi:hypothetical protein